MIRPFGRTTNLDVATAFLTALDGAPALERLPINEVSDTIKRFPPQVLPRANQILDRLRVAERARVQRLDRLIPMVAGADKKRGQQIFFGEQAKCSLCHRVGERGTAVGPDLSKIGSNRSTADLLESIVFPSASIVRQYESHLVLTTDGQVFSGIITREDANEVVIQQQVGRPILIRRDEIEQIAPTSVSIMPTGLDEAVSEQDLADLVRWLQSLK